MKRVILATIASALFCASAFADSTAATTTTTTTPAATTMSADECTAKLAQCADQACKDDLVKQGCKAEEAHKAN